MNSFKQFSNHLRTKRYGKQARFLPSCASTNDELRAWASTKVPQEQARDGAIVCAETQSQGRGRNGRAWHSPAQTNLYVSLLIRPTLSIQSAPLLSFVAGLAISEALDTFLPAQTQLKWPNDVLYERKKLSGLLLELSSTPKQTCEFVIIGFGINVNASKTDFPPSLQHTATSLFIETGKAIAREKILATVLNHMENRVDLFLTEGFSSIRTLWRARSITLGSRVEVNTMKKRVVGRAIDFDENGVLWVQSDQGEKIPIIAGDVFLLTPE